MLKSTALLVSQRIHAIESETEVTVKIPVEEPNLKLVAELDGEISKSEKELQKAQFEAEKYSGGLLKLTALLTVATHQETLALLNQRRMMAKYGIVYLNANELKSLTESSAP